MPLLLHDDISDVTGDAISLFAFFPDVVTMCAVIGLMRVESNGASILLGLKFMSPGGRCEFPKFLPEFSCFSFGITGSFSTGLVLMGGEGVGKENT